MVGRALLVFNGALGDTVAAIPGMIELARREGGLEVRGSAERLAILDAAGGDLAIGSIEGTGWHRLHAPGCPREALRIPVEGRRVHVPADADVARNLRRLGADPVPYRPLPDPGEPVHVSDHFWREWTGRAGRAPDPRLVARPGTIPARDEPYWVLHAGSGSATKNRPAGELATLLGAFPGRAVAIEGPADREAVAALAALGPVEVVRGLDLPGLVGLLAGARLYVGHDSGPTHVAAALGVPTAAIFTRTDPARWAPRGPRVAVVGPGEPVGSVVVAIGRLLDENQTDASRPPRPHPL